MEQKNNNAKFAFFYMLSLVALLFMALSAGVIVFQIINKNIFDAINQFKGMYNPDILKFAISALLISAPIYYLTVRQIFKNLFSGALARESGIRKWLTYFTLLVTSVVMIGWMIVVVNNFLDGELTLKIILKAITAIAVAASIFTFYFYDIRREKVEGERDKVIRAYFSISLAIVALIFISSFFFVETPKESRNRKIDTAIIQNFGEIMGAVESYYNENGELPKNLADIQEDFKYITNKKLEDLITGEKYQYKIVDENHFELCANFRTSNKETKNEYFDQYMQEQWPHDSGQQCIKQKVQKYNRDTGALEKIAPIPGGD